MPIVDCSAYSPSVIYKNGHLNTILSHYRRSTTKVKFHRHRLLTPDDDFIDIDSILKQSKKLVVLLHGLEGSSESSYIHTFSAKLAQTNRYDIRILNYRGCSGESNQRLQMYHSGATQDIDTLISYYQHEYEDIYVIGFSLGGNLILKYLGENMYDSHQCISKAVAISPPTDLESCSYKIMESQNILYEKRFLRSLKAKASEKAEEYPDQLSLSTVKSIRKLYDFDNLITGPIHGFTDASDYYAQSSSKQFLSSIHTPTLIITAEDDPFLSAAAIPYAEAEANDQLYLAASMYGGHVGFGGYKQGLSWMLEKCLHFMDSPNIL